MNDHTFNPNLPPEQTKSAIHSPEFKVSDTIKAAWELVKGTKGTFFAAMLILILVMFVAGIIQGATVGAGELLQLAVKLALNGVGICLLAGLVMLGVRRARGEEIKAMMITSYFSKFPTLLVAGLVMTIALVIGFLLFVVPGVYLLVSYTFVYPLIVDKNLGIWEAMETSRKLVHQEWPSYFGMYLALGLITSISAIPAGIGLIWTIPLGLICWGMLYNRAFPQS